MTRILRICFYGFALILMLWASVRCLAQQVKPLAVPGNLGQDLADYVAIPAIPGYEGELVAKLRAELSALKPVTDNLGDVVVTIGDGAPRRLIITPIDEPGFVVSQIMDDGYLRVQRLPQSGLPPSFNDLYAAQPVRIQAAGGKWIDGVTAGLSIHLQPERVNPPKSSDLENIYVDIGANSAAEVRKAGVDHLSAVAINRRLGNLNDEFVAGASLGDRFGAAALVELLRQADPSKIHGTLIAAFVVQQWAGARGLQRILSTIQADEMIYVGRLLPGGRVAGAENIHRAPRRDPGTGVLLGLEKTDGTPTGLAAELKQMAEANKIPFAVDYSADFIAPAYFPAPPLPEKSAHIGIATSWSATPAEMVSTTDLAGLVSLLEIYVQGERTPVIELGHPFENHVFSRPAVGASKAETVLPHTVEAYGVSGHEGPVRETVKRLLPPWAKPITDDDGNLILRLGTAPAGSPAPRILVVAHLDEIGFAVKSIAKDGRLELDSRGRNELNFFLGHPALVHTETADRDAILELPNGWDEAKFEWPLSSDAVLRADAGARTPEEAEKLGIKVGDTLTIPKAYRALLGTRAVGRSFDDRVGCSALIAAVWSLGGPLKDRDVTFVWSTSEEVGLVGAGKLAKRLAAEGREPDFVFAVDTFVSSDSPLESKRFADAQLGKGFVVRAVDNSNIVPHDLVEKVLKLARTNQIPVQFGVTGGGNDGAAFTRYGPVDVALGWPLRYSHSPAELVDTRDVDALSRIVAVIARSW